jgi:hypothetical protein
MEEGERNLAVVQVEQATVRKGITSIELVPEMIEPILKVRGRRLVIPAEVPLPQSGI